MNAWHTSFSSFIHHPQFAGLWLNALLKSFVVLTFAGGLCLAWRRAAAATKHLIWFLALASLLLLPLLPYAMPTAQHPLWSVSSAATSGNEISLSLDLPMIRAAATGKPGSNSSSSPASASPEKVRHHPFTLHIGHTWLTITFAVWACGMCWALVYSALGRFQLGKMSDRTVTLNTDDWTLLLKEACDTLKLRRRVALLQSRENLMPLTWGWLRPKVLLPKEADLWPIERRRIVLLHELAHVKRRDYLTQQLSRAICALYWFNPLAWLAARRMRIERERACDDLVLNGGCKASDYAAELVQIAQTFQCTPQAGGIAMARISNLEQRVTAIVDASRTRRLRPAGLAGIILSIAAVIFYIGSYKTSLAEEGRADSLFQEQLAQVENFSAQKEKQSQTLAAAWGEEISPMFQKFFNAAKTGDYQTVTNMYADFKAHHPQYGKNPRWGYRTCYWQPALEICLAYDHILNCDPKYTQMAVDGIMNAIPAGSIYFGGTDPGRGLPTTYSKSQVDANPFYTLSQNPLADSTYLKYLENTYGNERPLLEKLIAARQSDADLPSLDRQLKEAEQKAFTLELSTTAEDPDRLAAEKAVDDLSAKINTRVDGILKTLRSAENSGTAYAGPKTIYIATREEQQQCFADYTADAQARLKHDQEFPKEPKQVKPGEDIKVSGEGRFQVSGQVAVMEINARVAKIIFDKNPSREFYVEESFPLEWMYPYLEPAGLIMKINREPLAGLSSDVVQKDHDYWQSRVNGMLGNWLTADTSVKTLCDFAERVYLRRDLSGFTGDPAFVKDNYAPKMFSKWRSAIAGLYSWRMGISSDNDNTPSQYLPKNDGDRQRLTQETDFAFKQAVALCPSSPEAIHRYVNFLMKEKRNSDALLIAQTAAHLAPEEKQFKDLMGELSRHQESENTPAKNDFETLRALESRKTQAEANLDELKATLQTLKSQSRQELQKILPTLVPDAQFDTLMTRLNDAQMEVNRVKMTYAVSTTKYQSAQADVDTLQKQVQDRIDGILISLQVRIDASAALLDSLKKEIQTLHPLSSTGAN